jgi:hypothetical protein
MENFNLKKYLAEGKLLKEAQNLEDFINEETSKMTPGEILKNKYPLTKDELKNKVGSLMKKYNLSKPEAAKIAAKAYPVKVYNRKDTDADIYHDFGFNLDKIDRSRG